MNITVLFYFTIASCGMTTWFIKRILLLLLLYMRSDESFESLDGFVKSFIEEKCSELDVATEFKEKRVARKKRMAGEQSRDDSTRHFK